MAVTFDPVEPPRGLLRLAFRAPAHLFRARLGFLLGPRIVMIEHRGRRSGQVRSTCVEVVERESPDRIVIVSGYGEASQWYRNLAADPSVHCWMGARRRRASAELLDPEDGADFMVRYAHRNPKLAPRLMQLCGAHVDGGDDDYREVARRRLRFVRIVCDPA